MTSRKAKIQSFMESEAENTAKETKPTRGGSRKKAVSKVDEPTTDFVAGSASEENAKPKKTSNRGGDRRSANRKATIKTENQTEELNFEAQKPASKAKPAAKKPENGRKRSDNRQVLIAADPENGKINGIYLDAGHAGFILGLKVADIKSDTNKGTKKTKIAWLKVPAGDTLDQKAIERSAKAAFKEWKATGGVPPKKKPGRKPAVIDATELEKLIKKTDINKLDDKTMRKLKNLLAK